MKIDKFPKYIFWSYKENADLPESIVTEHVIKYGDIKDIILLTEIVNREIILKVIKKLSNTNKAKKRINFLEKVIL